MEFKTQHAGNIVDYRTLTPHIARDHHHILVDLIRVFHSLLEDSCGSIQQCQKSNLINRTTTHHQFGLLISVATEKAIQSKYLWRFKNTIQIKQTLPIGDQKIDAPI